MKRFIFTILCVSIFFIGVGAIIQKVGAMFKSDDKALIILKKSQTAIGGETKIKTVKSLSATGKAVNIFQIEGVEKPREGNFQLNLMLPNEMSKMIEMRFEGDVRDKINSEGIQEEGIFIVKDDDKVQMKVKIDDEKSANINREIKVKKDESKEKTNVELLRTVFSLFFIVPDNLNVSYFYGGEDTIDGAKAEIVECKMEDKSIAKLYLSKTSNLPLMMSYQDLAVPNIVTFRTRSDDNEVIEKNVKITTSRERSGEKQAVYTVKFSDYRDVNGLLMPFHWVQTADGKTDQTINIEKYEINPANIVDKLKPQEILIRTKKQ